MFCDGLSDRHAVHGIGQGACLWMALVMKGRRREKDEGTIWERRGHFLLDRLRNRRINLDVILSVLPEAAFIVLSLFFSERRALFEPLLFVIFSGDDVRGTLFVVSGTHSEGIPGGIR